MNKIKIAPSILSADFANLAKEVEAISNAGADYIHIDIMDGNFVPNLTIGPDVIKSIRKYSHLVFDVHLMINSPERHIKAFAEAGADIITVHAEATTHLHSVISQIKDLGKKAGLSLVPSSPESMLDYLIAELDLILIMTVNPGFGGQKFLASQLPKISRIRQKIIASGQDIDLEVDGGINPLTSREVIAAGADVLVAGSYIFSNQDYRQAIQNLRLT